MKIIEIRYRELVNTGNYENITVELAASLEPNDDVELCTAKLVKKTKRAIKEIVDGAK